MKVIIESTTKIVTAVGPGGAEISCRVWEGVSAGGVKVQCLIPRIAALTEGDLTEFEAELEEHAPPSVDLRMWPLRMVL